MAESVKIVAKNSKAYHDDFIEEKYEAGIELVGTEVKSCRMSKVNLKDSYVQIRNAEAFVNNMHISPYEKGNIFNRDPLRVRRLLLHKKEITKLLGLTAQKGYTLIPLRMYLKCGKVKLEVGVCRGKHLYDKRQDLKEKAVRRDMERRI